MDDGTADIGPRDDAGRETERVRGLWDRAAPMYDRQIEFWERVLFSGGREWVCSRARGEVLEIGVGTARNLPHYPPEVRLTGIDLSPRMLDGARDRARRLGREIDLRLGDAQALPFPDESFDTVVSTLSLCSIPDDRAAVREAVRVLRRGGRILLLEHVAGSNVLVRGVQRIIDVVAVRLQGDHQLREPVTHLALEGLSIQELERSKWGIVERVSAAKSS